jgi:hypothetical protein
MKYRECIIAYDVGGPIRVGPWPDKTGWSEIYERTVGACFADTRSLSGVSAQRQMLLDFHHAVVRDGVPVKDAHEAFAAIDEYRACMSLDVPLVANVKSWED